MNSSEQASILILIVSGVVSIIVGYFVIRGAVFSALRKHTIWLEDRAAHPDLYDDKGRLKEE